MGLKLLILFKLMYNKKIMQLPFNSIRALIEQKIHNEHLEDLPLTHPCHHKAKSNIQTSSKKIFYLALYKYLFEISYDYLIAGVGIEFQV